MAWKPPSRELTQKEKDIINAIKSAVSRKFMQKYGRK